ncbi:carotenoid-cleaving dioxygenase, mitochondrial-like [Brevipalpus obovatus]|uniref:carotenoid-cleaving dioxygenase, mitochondrial-like n=1 Tax=Brevipalpus obovatus TaxID=246614 RepID=UPI003D9F445D
MLGHTIARSCDQECNKPVGARIKGSIPKWLKGTLLRNGPGMKEIGGQRMGHLFDGLALIHQYEIDNGKVTFRSKFLRSEAYCRAMDAGRIVISELGTRAMPDPCKSFFKRYMTYFSPTKINDNAAVNIYPIGDKIYATTETPRLWEIDPKSLDSIKRLDMTDYVVMNTYSAHPHIERDGVIYNMGSNFVGKGSYKIIKTIPKSSSTGMMEVSVLSSIPIRHPLHPSYYHSFLTTEDYIIFIDQAFCISMETFVKNRLLGKPLATALCYKPEYKNHFVVIEKKTGQIIPGKYVSEPFVFFHTINAYQEDGHIICDICCFDDGQAWQDIFAEKMSDFMDKIQSGPFADTLFARGCRSKAKRFTIPLDIHDVIDESNSSLPGVFPASAFLVGKKIFLVPEVLTPENSSNCLMQVSVEDTLLRPYSSLNFHSPSDIAFVDMPQIHYVKCNGRKYRYFYGITRNKEYNMQLAKIDVSEKKAVKWEETDHYVSEPIFVPHPSATAEDDGVVLAAAISDKEENRGFLVILDGKSFKELARAEFTTPSTLTREFHGIFLGENNKPFTT